MQMHLKNYKIKNSNCTVIMMPELKNWCGSHSILIVVSCVKRLHTRNIYKAVCGS